MAAVSLPGSSSNATLSLALDTRKPKPFSKTTVDFSKTASQRLFDSNALTNLILSFVGNDHNSTQLTCKKWRHLGKRELFANDFLKMTGALRSKFVLNAVVKKVKETLSNFPNAKNELNFRALTLSSESLCCEHLIPTILRSCLGAHTLRLPAAPPTPPDAVFAYRALFAALQSMPTSLRTLDMRMNDPSAASSPFEILQQQEIDTSRITALHCSDPHIPLDLDKIREGFPALKFLEIEIHHPHRISRLADLIDKMRNLQHLKVVGFDKAKRLVLCDPQSKAQDSALSHTLKVVELVNCQLNSVVARFFQKAARAPEPQIILTNCDIGLENTSMTLPPDALKSMQFPPGEEKKEEKKGKK